MSGYPGLPRGATVPQDRGSRTGLLSGSGWGGPLPKILYEEYIPAWNRRDWGTLCRVFYSPPFYIIDIIGQSYATSHVIRPSDVRRRFVGVWWYGDVG